MKKQIRYRDSIEMLSEDFFNLWKNRISMELERVKIEVDEPEFATEEYLIFMKKATIVKAAYKAAKTLQAHIETNHRDELNFSKENSFPRKWMENPKIKTATDRCPAFYIILNYINNRNRRWRGEEYRNMIAEAKSFIGDVKYKKKNNETNRNRKHDYSTFLTNNAFYKTMTKETSLSKNTIQRYIAAFEHIGYLELLHDGKNKGRLYADGFFVENPDNKKRKISFMIESNVSLKKGLEKLPELINSYQRLNKEK